MTEWTKGYTATELDEAQRRYAIRFPPDLVELLREKRPIRGYDWTGDDPRIQQKLDWPLNMLLNEVDCDNWWTDWGERPALERERHEIVRQALKRAPRLIPLFSHRFIPETPDATGNPVFSMYGFDTIYYGANLEEYFANEFNQTHRIGATRHIPFWSDLVEQQDKVIHG